MNEPPATLRQEELERRLASLLPAPPPRVVELLEIPRHVLPLGPWDYVDAASQPPTEAPLSSLRRQLTATEDLPDWVALWYLGLDPAEPASTLCLADRRRGLLARGAPGRRDWAATALSLEHRQRVAHGSLGRARSPGPSAPGPAPERWLPGLQVIEVAPGWRGAQASDLFVLRDGFAVGRFADCDLCLRGPRRPGWGPSLAGLAARFRRDGQTTWLVPAPFAADLWLDDAPLPGDGAPRALVDGALLRIGPALLRYVARLPVAWLGRVRRGDATGPRVL